MSFRFLLLILLATVTRGVFAMPTAPLTFEPNHGQTDARADFLARGPGYLLWLGHGETALRLGTNGSVIRWKLLAAGPMTGVGESRTAATSNYLSFDDTRVAKAVPHFERVRYVGAWPGVELVYYGSSDGHLEYDFVLAPGTDVASVAFEVEGAQRLRLADNGDLEIQTAAGTLRQHAPVVYQQRNQQRTPIAARFVLQGATVRFAVEHYDPTLELVIDPVISYATFLGGSGDDRIGGIAVRDGETYVAGTTDSVAFPTTPGGLQASDGPGRGCFVSRFNATATQLIWSTYLDGAGDQECSDIAVDGDGEVYVAGTSTHQGPTADPGGAAFLAKLSSDGTHLAYPVVYRTGNGLDQATGIAVTASGEAFLAGFTDSTDFPVTIGTDGADRGGFSVKVATTGMVAWSRLIDGSGAQEIASVAVDAAGNSYFGGTTIESGNSDGFVVKLSPTGTLVWPAVARIEGSGAGDLQDRLFDLSVIAATGQVLVTGSTNSTNLPTTPGVLQPTSGGGPSKAFVGQLTANGLGFDFLSYYHPGSIETGVGIRRDDAGNLYVLTVDTLGTDHNVLCLGFLTPGATQLSFVRYLGDDSGDVLAAALAVSPDGTATYGATVRGLPLQTTPGVLGPTSSGAKDGYIERIAPGLPMMSLSADLVVAEGDSGSQAAVVRVSLSAASLQDTTFGLVTVYQSSAQPDSDYTYINTTFAIPAGEAFLDVPVAILGDSIDEPDEFLTLGVNIVPAQATLGDASTRITIIDNDAPPALSISATPSSVLEGALTQIKVQLSQVSGYDVQFRFRTEFQSAVEADVGDVYNDILQIDAGERSITIPMAMHTDPIDEATETFAMRVLEPVHATVPAGGAVATISITDTNPTPELTLVVHPDTQVEGAGNVVVEAWLSGPSSRGVTFHLATEAGTAGVGDFVPYAADLTIAAGELAFGVEVGLIDDLLDEPDLETFRFRATSVVNAQTVAGGAVATATIADNDNPPTLSFDASGCSVIEGDGGAVNCAFLLRLSAASGKTVAFNTSTANGTATAGSDYTGHASTARNITTGLTTLTINVPVLADTLEEVDETFALNVTGVTNASPGSITGHGTILDDDLAELVFFDGFE
ncbi:MAG: SBBP repeat-containing protein [Rhodanobacteraceae bacterium]|nr:SBBP repeat-containing protein [Rhodanobacteraceae bacterium]